MPQCYQSTIVHAPSEKIWDTLKNFHEMSWASPVMEQYEALGNISGTEVGAKRILNGVFHETLLECNDNEHRVRYSMDDGPSTVSAGEVNNYIGLIQLKPITLTGDIFVEWESSWESTSDEARDFCHQIYVALLNALAEQA